MQRVVCEERDNWRELAQSIGFDFHTIGGKRYWDETAYYAFTLQEIERDLEAPTAEIDALCHDFVARAVDSEQIMRSLRIPERFWNFIAASWKRGERSLYGRLDLSYDGQGPAKLLECNADTPTAVFETAVVQWLWFEDATKRGIVPSGCDQFNSVHERLIDAWKTLAPSGPVHFVGMIDSGEDAGTLAYLEDTARQAGLSTVLLAMEAIGRRGNEVFVDLAKRPLTLAFKLYPWEWMFREKFGLSLPGAPTRWIEPPWKAILSNKGALPLLWSMYPNHPNLLPAYFEDDPGAAKLGNSYVRKPLYSREGANISLVVNGAQIDADPGPYGEEGYIRQALALLPQFAGNYAVVGSWIVNGNACGLCVREDLSPITKNTSRFLPHVIVG
jgi:glutathionylspermidine synthase